MNKRGNAIAAMPFSELTIPAAAVLSAPAGWASWFYARKICQAKIWPAAVMIVSASVLAAWAAVIMPANWLLPASAILGIALLTLAAIDAACLRLPDVLTLPLAGAGLAVALFLPGAPVLDHCIGAAGGFAVFASLGWGFERFRGYEGMGLGDAKLAAATGAWLGWAALPSVVLIACAAGFVWIGVRVLLRGTAAAREKMAFGVPLCIAFWIVWLYGPLEILAR